MADNDILGTITKPITDKWDEVTAEIGASIGEKLNLKQHVDTIYSSVEEHFKKDSALMAFFQSIGNFISEWAEYLGDKIGSGMSALVDYIGNILGDTLGAPKSAILTSLASTTLSKPISTGHSLDGAAISGAVATALNAANNGVSRVGGFFKSDEEKADSRALNAAKIAYAGVTEKTLDALVSRVLTSDLYKDVAHTPELRASIRKSLTEDPAIKDKVKHYVEAEANAISGVNAKGEKVGNYGVYAAALTAINGDTAAAVTPGPQTIAPDTVLASIMPTLALSANKEKATQLFLSLPASLIAEIRKDEAQQKAIIEQIVLKKITPDMIAKFKKMDDPTIKRLVEALDETKENDKHKPGYKASLDTVLRDVVSLSFSEDGKSLTVKARDGGHAEFSDITYQSTPASPTPTTPAVQPQ